MHRLGFLIAPTGHLILLSIAGIKISPVKCWLMHNKQGKKRAWVVANGVKGQEE